MLDFLLLGTLTLFSNFFLLDFSLRGLGLADAFNFDAHLTALVSFVSGRRFRLSLGHEYVCYWSEEKKVKAMIFFVLFTISEPSPIFYYSFIHFLITITAISPPH